MHDCASRCCQDTVSSMEGVQKCVELCSSPVNKAQRSAEPLIYTIHSLTHRRFLELCAIELLSITFDLASKTGSYVLCCPLICPCLIKLFRERNDLDVSDEEQVQGSQGGSYFEHS